MGSFELLLLVIGGLWLYGRCSQFVLARHYASCLDDIELMYHGGDA